jgi:hypothetical protein
LISKEYLRKRLWNLGYTIQEIQDAEFMDTEIDNELNNIMLVGRNPSNEELIEALNECHIYKRSD